MGQALLKSKKAFPDLVEETQIFSLWSIADVRELKKRFTTQVNGFALVEAQFETIMSFKKDVTNFVSLEELFKVLDNDNDGRLDGLELLGGIALCCQATFEEKAQFCFELYDFNLNSSLSKREMIMMMIASICGMISLTGGDEDAEPELEVFEHLAEEAFQRADRDNSGDISFNEFVLWARSNRDLMSVLDSLSKASLKAKQNINPEDSAEEADEKYMSDTDLLTLAPKVTRKKADNLPKSDKDKIFALMEIDAQWTGQIWEPTHHKTPQNLRAGPDTNLELTHAFGYRCEYSRNNVRYVFADGDDKEQPSLIVYTTAALGVIYNSKTRSQKFYEGHNCEITCIAIHPSGQMVATGDRDSAVHLWNASKLQCLRIINVLVKQGVEFLAISPSGDRIATVGCDSEHTIAMYDLLTTGEIISSSKGLTTPNKVFGIAYSPDGTEVAMVGQHQVKFYMGVNTEQRAIRNEVARIGKIGKKQTFYCVAFISGSESACVVGCASGEVYKFKGHSCVLVVQVHGVQEPVFSIHYSTQHSVLVTGSKDGTIKTLDNSLGEVGSPLDMSEDLDGDGKADNGSLDSAVISVEYCGSSFLVGTRGGDIFEAKLPVGPQDPYSLSRVAWSHCGQSINGLAAHPTRDEFATVGSDKTLRVWNIRTKAQVNIRKLPEVATAIVYSPLGNILAIGMADGTVALIEADQSFLRVYCTWKHCAKPISDLKFSPNTENFAVASRDSNVYLYSALPTDKKRFRRMAVCKGHSEAVTHIDFSSNSKYLQSNGEDLALLYWDMNGSEIKHGTIIRDIVWSTITCVFGFTVKGIWPPRSSYTEINCVSALPELGVVATGDHLGRVNLYRYPSFTNGALFQSYVGHSSGTNGVKFSYNRRHLVSIGGSDKTILIWKHELEVEEDSDSEGTARLSGSGSSISSASSNFGERKQAAGEDGPVGGGFDDEGDDPWTQEDSKPALTDIRQWKSSLVEPTVAIHKEELTDCDFDLKWVHGYRCNNVCNNVFYSARSDIVYHAARVCIVYNRNAEQQRFLQGAHSDDVSGIAAHPDGNIFASSDVSSRPLIIIWDSTDMKVTRRIQNAHVARVTLLAFSSKGNMLASVGQDENNTLVVHDHENGAELMRTPVSKRRVTCLCFMFRREQSDKFAQQAAQQQVAVAANKPPGSRGPGALLKSSAAAAPAVVVRDDQDVVVTGGNKNVVFWHFNGQNVKSQKGLWGRMKKVKVHAVASAYEDVCVTTHADGSLVLWQKMRAVFNTKADIAVVGQQTSHNSKVRAIWAIHGEPIHCHLYDNELLIDTEKHKDIADLKSCARYITGDERGIVAVWCLVAYDNDGHEAHGKIRYGLHCLTAFGSEELSASKKAAAIRSICARDGSLLVGLESCEIVQIKEVDINYTSPIVLKFVDDLKQRRKPVKGAASRGEGPHKPFQLSASLSAAALSTAGTNASLTQPNTPATASAASPAVAGAGNHVDSAGIKRSFLSAIHGELLVSGHNGEGEVCALAMMPKRELYFTAGDDYTLRCWNYKGTQELISFAYIPNETSPARCRAIDIHPDDSYGHLAMASTSGEVYIVILDDFIYDKGLKKEVKRVDAKSFALDSLGSAASCVKYSFEGSHLVISTLDGFLNVYSLSESKDSAKYLKLWRFQAVNCGCISQIDFGVKLIHSSVDDPVQVVQHDVKSARGVTLKEVRHLYVTRNTISCYNAEKRAIETTRSKIIKTFLMEDGEEVFEGIQTEPATMETHALTPDNICMQVASSESFELKFFLLGKIRAQNVGPDPSTPANVSPKAHRRNRKTEKEVVEVSPETPSSLKDAWWATWSLPFGWPVQGIWPAVEDGSVVNAVARANSWETVPVVAAVDEHGRLRVLNYPSVIPGSPDKCYRGHSKNIRNIKFAPDDSFCVTVGGTDRCVFVWGTDICDAVRELYAASNKSSTGHSGVGISHAALSQLAVEYNNVYEDPAEDSLDSVIKMQQQGLLQDQAFSKASSNRSHPWRRVIREPSEWVDNDKLAESPEKSLELKYVYGYHGWDCTNNIGFTENTSSIVYHIAGVGIVLNQDTGNQIHNTEHDGEICCLNVHADGHSIVTGDRGDSPKIVVWDTNTGVTISVIRYHSRGVASVAFSRSGKLVVSVGMDAERKVAVHNHRTGAILGSGKAGAMAEIRAIAVCGDEYFLTAGKHHMTFWTLPSANAPGGPLQSRNGIFKHEHVSRTVCSACFMGADAVTGAADGHIVMWKDRTTHRVSSKGHAPGAQVNAVASNGTIVVSGATDGKIIVWNLQLLPTMTIDLSTSTPTPIAIEGAPPQIQALALKEDRLLVGTRASEIYDISILNPTQQCSRVVEGHFNDLFSGSVGGCNCVSAHPKTANKIATCGDDHSLRLWNLKNDAPLAPPKYQTSLPASVAAVAFDPEGSELAVATTDGTVRFLSSSNLAIARSVVSVTTQQIKCLQYSPDGTVLAVGTYLGIICLVDVVTSSCKNQLCGHVGGITGIDFSSDSAYIQTTSQNFELYFWSVATGEQLNSASEARDFVWATQNCIVGWPMQGVWGDDDTEIVASTISPDRKFLCVSDNNHCRISLYQYPLPMEMVEGKHYKGHSSRVSAIRFSYDGKYVISTGGFDKSIMKWAVLKR
jgi:WD40 repeat protein/Ca2+-binding EF-hand superfamily protein